MSISISSKLVYLFSAVGFLLVPGVLAAENGDASLNILRELTSEDICMLCEEGINQIMWPLSVIESDGTTCSSKALEMAMGHRPNTGKCNKEIEGYRETCCSGVPPKQVDFIPPDPNANVQKVGPHPICPVCYTGDYPSETAMVLTVLYIGSGSCAQFEKVGRQGLIPAHLCDPIQHFGHEPCGCGEFNDNLKAQSLPAPTQAQYNPPTPTPPSGGIRGNDITTLSTPQPTPTPPPAPDVSSSSTLSGIWEGAQERLVPDPDGKEDTSVLSEDDRGGAGGVRRRNLKGAKTKRT